MLNAWKSLFKSRKLWLALLAILQSCIMAFTNVPIELWLSIDALLVAVILAIAWEDSAMKAAGNGGPMYQGLSGLVESLMRSRKVWLAAAGVLQTFLFYFVPAFPKEVWMSIDGLLIVVIASIAWEDAALKRAAG